MTPTERQTFAHALVEARRLQRRQPDRPVRYVAVDALAYSTPGPLDYPTFTRLHTQLMEELTNKEIPHE